MPFIMLPCAQHSSRGELSLENKDIFRTWVYHALITWKEAQHIRGCIPLLKCQRLHFLSRVCSHTTTHACQHSRLPLTRNEVPPSFKSSLSVRSMKMSCFLLLLHNHQHIPASPHIVPEPVKDGKRPPSSAECSSILAALHILLLQAGW